MKKITLTFLIIILTTILYGQEVKISVAPTINNTLHYHFTAGGPGHNFKPGFSTSLEYTLQKGKRINYGFGLSYQFCQVGYTPNMNTGDFIGQTDRVNLISVNLISVCNLKKNFYLSFIPLIDFHLNYDSENISKLSHYWVSSTGVADLKTSTEYEYDNMFNPYQSFKRLKTPGVYTNSNNITKETHTIDGEVDQLTEKIQITENSYEYNDKGYPVKVNGLREYVYK